MGFAEDTALAPAGTDRWRGEVPPTWSIGFGTNGGFPAALAARAAELATGAPPRSLTLHYLAPPAEAAIEVAKAIHGANLAEINGEVESVLNLLKKA